MPITTLDGAIAGMRPPEDFLKVGAATEAAGIHHSFAYTAGRPVAATIPTTPTTPLAGTALTSYTGQIPWVDPATGFWSYLARFQASASTAGTLILYDRLWHNAGIVVTTTTEQGIGSVAFPARDRDGTANGENVLVGIEVSTATTNAAVITGTVMSYTNQGGTSGRTATMASFPATAVVGTFVPFQLAAEDTGVRSIQNITLGTAYGGVIHLVAYRILARLELPIANTVNAIDALTSGFVRCYNNTVPFLLWLPSATAAATVTGQLIITQG